MISASRTGRSGLGLIAVVDKFDPELKPPFSALAGLCIKRAIFTALKKANQQKPALREAAIRLGLRDALSEENYFPKLSEAVTAYEQQKTPQG
jgi:DNA-directed RNA polymerase specialized sigma subunit